MCNKACLDFLAATLQPAEVQNKWVIESGARNVNGTFHDQIRPLNPKIYIGTDIEAGPNVDVICDATKLVNRFRAKSWDMVVSTEMLEHAQDWRGAVNNFKRLLKPGGILYLTTRSRGFPFHGYPHDYWRFEIADMQYIFSDMEILNLNSDLSPGSPGVFLKARRPKRFVLNKLEAYNVYSIAEE